MKQYQLNEDVQHSGQTLSVDKEKGVIPGIKIIGLTSKNGYDYSHKALSEAAKLYEGKQVNCDHIRGSTERKASDRFGKLLNVRVGNDGLYADLHYLKSHPMANMVVEAAERMPDAFGFSHHAVGNGSEKSGRKVIESITRVRSVDLVADPATTKGLFESEDMPKTITEADGAAADATAIPVLSVADAFSALRNALMAETEDDEQPNVIKALNKFKKQVLGGSADAPAEEAPAEDGSQESELERELAGKIKLQEAELAKYKTEKLARSICSALGLAAEDTLVESLVLLGTEDKMRAHGEWLKKNMAKPAKPAPRSRSGYQVQESEAQPVVVPTEPAKLVDWLRS